MSLHPQTGLRCPTRGCEGSPRITPVVYGYMFCGDCKKFSKADFDYLEDYQHYIAQITSIEKNITTIQKESSKRMRKQLGYSEPSTAKKRSKRSVSKKASTRKVQKGNPKPKPKPEQKPKNCSQHPNYTGQRRPRSGCETCLEFYQGNKK